MNANESLVGVKSFGPRLALAAARVPADAAGHAAIAQTWLCGDEHQRSARFRVDHARADFLAGRIAAKSAAAALAPEMAPSSRWEIIGGQHQQPRLDHQLRGYSVSIAHAGGLGLAVVHASEWRCGIDLEPVDRDADDAIASQVSPTEAAWARGAQAEQRLRWLLLWTAREAQGKSFGTGLLEPERLAAITNWQPVAHGWQAQLVGDATTHVRAVVAGGFVVTLVVPASVETDSIAEWIASVVG